MDSKKKYEEILELIFQIGSLVPDTHNWDNELRTKYEKVVKYLKDKTG